MAAPLVIAASAIGVLTFWELDLSPGSTTIPAACEQTEGADSCAGLLCGTWEGTWSGGMAIRLVVETTSGGTAAVLYAWGDDLHVPLKGGWERVWAKILPDGSLHWGYPGQFILRLTADGHELDGEYGWGGQVARIRLRRVS